MADRAREPNESGVAGRADIRVERARRAPAELRSRMQAAAAADASARDLTAAAAGRLNAVLDLIAGGRGIREAGSGLNVASRELLVADGLITEAAARAARDGALADVQRALDLEALSDRARDIDRATELDELARDEGSP